MSLNSYTATTADTYFSVTTHPMAKAWRKLDVDQKAAFMAMSKRVLSRFIDDDIEDEINETTETEPRYDYSVYEQALYIALRSGAAADGAEAGPKWLGYDGGQEGHEIAPEALRWMGMGRTPQVLMQRG